MDLEKLKKRLEDLNKAGSGSSGGMDWLKLKDGRNVVRILPGKDGEDFASEAYLHYGVGKTDKDKNGTTVICPTTLDEGARCPICELTKEIRKLKKKDGDQYDKQAREMGRKKRVYFNAIDRGDDLNAYEKGEDGKWKKGDEHSSPIKVLATGIGVYKDVIKNILDPEIGDITDADNGIDVIIEKSGTGMKTEYDVRMARSNSPIGFAVWQECLHDIVTLGSKAKIKTYKEIEAIMDNTPDSGDSSDEPEEDGGDGGTGGAATDTPEKQEPTGDAMGDEIAAMLAKRRGNK